MASSTGPKILGSLRSADGKGVVRMEDRVYTDIEDVWSALTDPSRLALWYGRLEGDLHLGGEYEAHLHASGWQGTGRVDACEPPRRLKVVTRETAESWQQGDGVAPFDQTHEATLTEDGGQTILVIETRGMPLDKIHFYGVGWQIHAENLASYLAGGERSDAEARWDALLPPYLELGAALG